MPRTVLGKVSLTPRGAYSEEASYTALDLVSYNGSGYIALKNVQGVAPSNDDVNWMLLVSKGDTGATGSQGVSVIGAEINESGNLIITLDAGEPINAGSAVGPKGDTGDTGATGPQGVSIDRIERTSGSGASGSTDTYTVYLTDGSTAGTFQVYNGADGTGTGDFKADGTVPMTGDLQMGAHKVTGMADGTADTDGATVGQLNTALGGKADADITGSEIPVSGTDSTTVEAALSNKADVKLSNLADKGAALANLGAAPRPNLLDNWYFVGGGSQQGGGQLPINQRGETSYSGAGVYTIDRWKNVGNAVTTINDDGISFTAISNANLRQFLGIPNLDGLTLTASILYKSVTSGTCHLIIRNSKDAELKRVSADSAGLVTTTFQVPQGSGRLSFESNANAGIGFKLIAAKLELGPTQTLAYQDEDGNWQLFETPDYGEELAKCQRYLVVYTVNEQRFCGVGHLDSASAVQSVIWTPVPMRIAPTISGDVSIYGADNNLSGTNLTGTAIGPSGIRVDFSVSNAVNYPATVMIYTTNSLMLSAEL